MNRNSNMKNTYLDTMRIEAIKKSLMDTFCTEILVSDKLTQTAYEKYATDLYNLIINIKE